VGPSELLESLSECPHETLCLGVVLGRCHQYANAPQALALRSRHQRECHRTADERDKLAPPHSITSSALASSAIGTLKPWALAVLRLTENSNLLGCCTGRSPGFSPLRMRST